MTAWSRPTPRANNVPEALVHRVIVRESKYHPGLVGRGGTIGLMQIKLPTARGLGYTGDAAGLRDPNTNLAWGIKYLAGAYRAANGDHNRAVRYYAGGYYYAAKRQRQERPIVAMRSRCLPVMRRRKSLASGSNGENARRGERNAGSRPIAKSHVPGAVRRVALLRRTGTSEAASGPRLCSAPLTRCAASGARQRCSSRKAALTPRPNCLH